MENSRTALEHSPPFSLSEAKKRGLSRRMIYYYLNEAVVERVGRGLYQGRLYEFDGDIQFEDLVTFASQSERGVVCLVSALFFYGLTDEFMREFWMATPFGYGPYHHKGVRYVRYRNIELGQEKINYGGLTFKIFNRERTIIDCFKNLDLELSLSALKKYLQGGEEWKPNLDLLDEYAKKLRTPINSYVRALLI